MAIFSSVAAFSMVLSLSPSLCIHFYLPFALFVSHFHRILSFCVWIKQTGDNVFCSSFSFLCCYSHCRCRCRCCSYFVCTCAPHFKHNEVRMWFYCRFSFAVATLNELRRVVFVACWAGIRSSSCDFIVLIAVWILQSNVKYCRN